MQRYLNIKFVQFKNQRDWFIISMISTWSFAFLLSLPNVIYSRLVEVSLDKIRLDLIISIDWTGKMDTM